MVRSGFHVGGFNDFAHPGKMGPQTSPKTRKERNSERETGGEGSFWYLPGGPVGEILDG